MLAHAAALAGATDVPVSADLEHGFAADAAGVADTVRLAVDAGLAGCSIEDCTRRDDAIYRADVAAARVAAAAGPPCRADAIVVTAAPRTTSTGRRPGRHDRRLQAYEEAGADVLYAPGLVRSTTSAPSSEPSPGR